MTRDSTGAIIRPAAERLQTMAELDQPDAKRTPARPPAGRRAAAAKAPAGAEPDSNGGGGGGGAATFLLGAVGLLAALLAALATANGGIDRIERNERWALFAGTVGVLVAIAFGALYTALSSSDAAAPAATDGEAAAEGDAQRGVLERLFGTSGAKLAGWLRLVRLRVLLLIGILALAGGLIAVAYSAVSHVAGRPGITATLTDDPKLGVLLTGAVTESDLAASTHLEMRVDIFIPGQVKGVAKLVQTTIYAASLGPDSSGNIDHAYQVILPQNTYQVLVQAWTGKYGYCFNSQIPKKAPPHAIVNDLGCLRLRLPPALTASH